MRVLPTRVHGVVDYVWGALLLALPLLLGAPLASSEGWIALVFGAGAILYSALTRYELGLVPVIPMPVHLALDAVAGLVLAAAAFLLVDGGPARAVLAAFGVFAVCASLVTRTSPET